MRSGRSLIPFLVLLMAGCQSQSTSLSQEDRAALALEVEETLGRLTEAMNAHDPDRVLSFFRESDEFLYLGCTDFMLGYRTFSTRVGPFYQNSLDVTFQQDVVRTQVLSPTVAVVALRGGSSEVEALFWTEVLVRESDGEILGCISLSGIILNVGQSVHSRETL